jgi:hypothetical protein
MKRRDADRVAELWEGHIKLYEHDGISALTMQHECEWYIITTGTGDGCFAYLATDVQKWIEDFEAREDHDETDTYQGYCDAVNALEDHDETDTYQDFCDSVNALEDHWLAVEVYRNLELVVCSPGLCTPILSDEDIWDLDNPR